MTVLAGVGALYFAFQDHDFHLQCFRVEQILNEGGTLQKLEGFLETPECQKAWSEHGSVLVLSKGDVAWVPYGWVCIPFGMPLSNKEFDRIAYLHLPIFNTKMLEKLPTDPDVWNAIKNLANSFLRGKTEHDTYGDLAKVWQKFLQGSTRSCIRQVASVLRPVLFQTSPSENSGWTSCRKPWPR